MPARMVSRALPAIAVAIAAAACAPGAHAYELGGIPWPGRPATITYWNGTEYGPQVAQAVAAWNGSGARIRFVRAPKRRADLRIVEAQGRPPDRFGIPFGLASVGYQPRNRVALGRGVRGAAAVGLVAHELGHVLGLVHHDERCALMNTLFWTRCIPAPTCSILQRDDVRGAIRRYGGRARALRPVLCPPPPAALAVRRETATGRIEALVTLPQGDVAGVLTLRAVGRCPERPTRVIGGREARAGATVRVDVTPRGSLVGLTARQLCVRAWTYDPTGRISAQPATQQYAMDPAGP